MKKRIIYLPLMGRIGNQLFQYAYAYTLQKEYSDGVTVIIDESSVINAKWINSLRDYDLPDVKYVPDMSEDLKRSLKRSLFAFRIYRRLIVTGDARKQYKRELKYHGVLNRLGLIAVLRGYCPHRLNKNENLYMYGYFQSERYFMKHKDEIRSIFNLTKELQSSHYPGLEKIENRNTVCISIKIEHNVGSEIYDVCNTEYYRKGIEYIEQHVNNPLYFLCSDNVEKAKELFFEGFDREIICQPKGFNVSLSLCAMSKCKYFIINNTSFGWWAQYLSDYAEKIVVAPSRWKLNNDPENIYDNQENWHLI